MPVYVSASVIESVREHLLSQECEYLYFAIHIIIYTSLYNSLTYEQNRYSAVHGFLVPAPSNTLLVSNPHSRIASTSATNDTKQNNSGSYNYNILGILKNEQAMLSPCDFCVVKPPILTLIIFINNYFPKYTVVLLASS